MAHGEIRFAGAGGADAEGDDKWARMASTYFFWPTVLGVTLGFLPEVWMRSDRRSLSAADAFVVR